MKKLLNKIGLFGSIAILLIVGCATISGTWILTYQLSENDTLVWYDDFYYGSIDMSDDGTWEDHVDNIKDINMIGLEVWGTNNTSTDQEYDVYLDGAGSTLSGLSTRSEVAQNATLVLESLPLKSGGQQFISYGQSLEYVRNVDKIKDLLEAGEMKFFAFSNISDTTNIHIDSVNIVITFTAGY
ncbi:MAG: hypothetical protein ABIJ12_01535 [bacterium]